MTRMILIVVGVIAVVALGFFALTDRTGRTGPDARATEALPAQDESRSVAQDNMSSRVAADIATDEAFERAQAGQEPVQETVDTSRALGGQTGAVGGTAFTAEGYDRLTVVEAIETSNLDEARKEDLVLQLDEAAPQEERLELVLAEVRLALALEQ